MSTLWLLLQEEDTGAVAPAGLVATVAAGPQITLSWSVTGILSETGYSIQRRDSSAGGSFAQINTVGPNVGSYTDTGPFTPGDRYAYRIEVIGGPSDGEVSNQISVLGTETGITRRHRRIRR